MVREESLNVFDDLDCFLFDTRGQPVWVSKFEVLGQSAFDDCVNTLCGCHNAVFSPPAVPARAINQIKLSIL